MEKKLLKSFTTIVLITLTAGLFALPDSARAGSIVSWGNDGSGQVSGTPAGYDFTAIASGQSHSLALRADGSIVSWGTDNSGVVSNTPTETGFTAIAGGGAHSLALRVDGSIVSWGSDAWSQVSNTPTETGFTAIAGGGDYSLALRADGSIAAWGRDSEGQVGNTPTETGFTAIACGNAHSLALRADGSIAAWGKDTGGVVSNTPTENGFTAIASGARHSLALKADGSIVSWGTDDFSVVSNTPTESGFTAMDGGYYHSLALRADGSAADRIKSWGWDNTGVVSLTPAGTSFTAIAAAGWPSHALLGPPGVHFLNPIPADGSTAHVSLNQLQWTLPDPNEQGDVVTCVVSFGTNPSIWENPKIVGDPDPEAVESVSVTLTPDTTYYWAIVLYDSGIPDGWYDYSPVFTFYAVDNFPPIVNAGDDVTTWLVDGERVVQLDGDVNDPDGGPGPATIEWTVIFEPNELNPATFDDANLPNATVTVRVPGSYILQLEAGDGDYTVTDTMQIEVYADSCEHASNQEGFEWLAVDLNHDCKVDFVDFANVAASWLEEYYSTE